MAIFFVFRFTFVVSYCILYTINETCFFKEDKAMTRQDLEARLAKAQEAVTKKQGTLERHLKKEAKIRKQIEAKGWNPDGDRYDKYGTADHDDYYWLMCDLSDAQEAIENTRKAIAEKQAIVEKWQDKLNEQVAKEEQDDTPAVLRDYQEKLVQAFDTNDKIRKDFLREKLQEIGYKEFVKKYSYSAYDFAVYEDAQTTHKNNVRTAEALVNNLWTRVKEICKDVTDCRLWITRANEFEGICINGTVEGTDGNARVESITAGGYNIQKLHVRTLVHKF